MTIVYCIDTIYRSGGMERVLTEKANYLADKCGYEVYVVTCHQKGRPAFFALSPKVHHVDLKVNIRIPFLGILYKRRLRALIEKVKADVCISLGGVEMPLVACMDAPCPKISEFHFSYDSYAIRGKSSCLPRYIKYASMMDRFVVLTKEDEAKWKRHLNNVVQIYNPSTFPVGGGIALENKRCISGGRLSSQKNYMEMLQIWADVVREFPDWKLDIYGTGPEQGAIMDRIAVLGIAESVAVHPPIPDIRKEMEQSSIYLMTSLYEGFPMALTEAASIGLPAIAYACPTGPSEAISNGRTGMVVSPGDRAAMISVLKTLMADANLRAEMGRNALSWSGRFTKETIMSQWTALFASLR